MSHITVVYNFIFLFVRKFLKGVQGKTFSKKFSPAFFSIIP